MATVQPVIRALNALSALAPEQRGLSLQELANSLEIPVGSAHRLLAVLHEQDFVSRSPTTRRYFLGPQARRLGMAVSVGFGRVIQPPEAVSRAAQDSGETAFLTELVGQHAICVALAEGRHPLRLRVAVGQPLPLHSAAAGRVLLAHVDRSVAAKLLGKDPLPAFTNQTTVTVAETLNHLDAVRERGYDVCDNELDLNVWAVAVPVWRSTGQVCASITIAAPAWRAATAASRNTLRKIAQAASATMSAEFGYDVMG